MALRVAWLSRHPLGAEQVEDLKRVLGVSEVQVISENVTWAASEDAQADVEANASTWRRVAAKSDLLAGVIPPVAIEAVWALDEGPRVPSVWSPVSRQSREVRADGSARVEFHHVRWARIR